MLCRSYLFVVVKSVGLDPSLLTFLFGFATKPASIVIQTIYHIMILAPSLLGMLPEKPSFLETIIYQINGLMIVFVVLGSLWLLTELMGAYFKRRDAQLQKGKAAALEAKAAAVPSTKSPVSGSVTPEIIAVVTAAVHTTLAGRRHRVVSVTPGTLPGHATPQSSVWAAEGRRDIFASRKPR